ncbi:hypothetical protein SK128_007080 [Halocaridina rubra]|uniref:C2H2-type domain-containing protein n=1 Tax=Halocaridina rubra TaxID=373956 RepID=A0AAN9A8P7_HALRR
MDLLMRSNFCSFCLRNISERRQVRGGIRLKHSGSSVSVVIGYIMGQDIPIAALCFRCYKLILGIDYHQHEFKRLKDLLVKLYKERCVTVERVRSSDFNKTLIEYSASLAADGITADAKALFSACASFASTSSHLSMDHDTLERYFLCESDTVMPSENSAPSVKTVNVVHKIIKDDVIKDIKMLDITIGNMGKMGKTKGRLSERKRKSKKLSDYEYYTDCTKEPENIEGKIPENRVTISNSTAFEQTETELTCTICHSEFASNQELSKHACMHSLKNEVSYICKGCQMQFSVRQLYIKHIQSCYKNVPVKCDLCSAELKSAAYLPRHLKAFHNKSTPLLKDSLCDLCGRSFSRKEALQRHQAKVHDVSHGTFQCSKCGQTFTHISFLSEHMRAHKGYPCPECKKNFTCMSNLKLHKQTAHQNKELYSCTLCKRKWKFHASYTHHMRKVHNAGLFKCVKCKVLFSAEDAFEKHKFSCKGPSKKAEDIRKFGTQNEVRKLCRRFPEQKQTNLSESYSNRATESTESNKLRLCIPKNKMPETHEHNDVTRYQKEEDKARSSRTNGPHTRSKSGKSCSKIYIDHIMEEHLDELEQYKPDRRPHKYKEAVLTSSKEHLETNELVYPISNLSSTSEIVLETLEDATTDCQCVILVDDYCSEPR